MICPMASSHDISPAKFRLRHLVAVSSPPYSPTGYRPLLDAGHCASAPAALCVRARQLCCFKRRRLDGQLNQRFIDDASVMS